MSYTCNITQYIAQRHTVNDDQPSQAGNLLYKVIEMLLDYYEACNSIWLDLLRIRFMTAIETK